MYPNIKNPDKVIYPELSYKIMGVLFDVHNQLGNRYQEKYYSRAVRLGFQKIGLKFEKELMVNLMYDNKIVGKYYLDFLVESKIVIEIKAVPIFSRKDFKQILGYLKAKKLELGILVNFRNERLQYKRILNSDLNKNNSDTFGYNSDKFG